MKERDTPRGRKKPRFSAGGRIVKHRLYEIWSAYIDEKDAHWMQCVAIHRSSYAEAEKMRNLLLKAMNK